jgi:multidrug efflux pump subunit AcrA (membrane-fusion protein)
LTLFSIGGVQLMKKLSLVACGLVVGAVAVCELASRVAHAPAAPAGLAAPALPAATLASAVAAAPVLGAPAAPAQPPPPTTLEVAGRTRCPVARRGIIASAILRPVVEVLVGPGERVTKGQVLVKLFDLEPQAKIRAREKELRSIEARAEYSRRNLDLVEKSLHTGALPGTSYNDVRSTALYYESQKLAAEAELSLAQAELKLYTVTATIDGEVAWLDVSPGTVTWPGTLIWGEIVDLRELEVRCELSPVQAEQVAVGQSAEVRLDGQAEPAGTGKVVLVGKLADRTSGLVPVMVRMANPQERMRADVSVKLRFQTEKAK